MNGIVVMMKDIKDPSGDTWLNRAEGAPEKVFPILRRWFRMDSPNDTIEGLRSIHPEITDYPGDDDLEMSHLYLVDLPGLRVTHAVWTAIGTESPRDYRNYLLNAPAFMIESLVWKK